MPSGFLFVFWSTSDSTWNNCFIKAGQGGCCNSKLFRWGFSYWKKGKKKSSRWCSNFSKSRCFFSAGECSHEPPRWSKHNIEFAAFLHQKNKNLHLSNLDGDSGNLPSELKQKTPPRPKKKKKILSSVSDPSASDKIRANWSLSGANKSNTHRKKNNLPNPC